MRSVIEHDDNTIKDGKLVSDAINRGFSSFVPDMMFDSLVKDYSFSENIYGESLIRLITGFDPGYLRKNIRVPEFQRELKGSIKSRIDDLKDKGLIDETGRITEKGIWLSGLVLYTEELDRIKPGGIWGEKEHKKAMVSGEKKESSIYRKGARFRDIDIHKSIRKALRRKHEIITEDDLVVDKRQKKGRVEILYCIDSSGSMKGKKIEAAKKAGIALAYHMIEKRDRVGIISFGTEITDSLAPSRDFNEIIYRIAKIRAARETNMTLALRKALDLFRGSMNTRHVILITDALPTIGKNPKLEAIESASMLVDNRISVSVIGIGLDKKGEELAKKITEIGKGNLYSIKDINDLDHVVLEDYNIIS